MKPRLLTFNDVELVTKIIINNDVMGLYEFCTQYNNIIDLLKKFKNTLFESKDSVSVKISTENFTGDVVIERHNVLKGLPENDPISVDIGNLTLTLGYPKIAFPNFELNKLTCIKAINGIEVHEKDISQLIYKMPLSLYKDISNYIEENIISKLNNTYIYYTINKSYRSKFTFDLDGLINLFIIICKYDIDYLMKLKLILVKEGNFNLKDFSYITVEETNKYYKLLKDIYKDESNQ